MVISEIEELKDRIRVLSALKYHASANALRKKLRALTTKS